MSVPSHPYRPLIERIARLYPPITPDVLEACAWVESGFDPTARSASGARGLMQIIPAQHAAVLGVKVADEMGVRLTDALWDDPEFSLRAGARHLAWLYTVDDTPSWERAIRAYHSGRYDPPVTFRDGQGTSSDAHITKFRSALSDVQALRSQGTTAMPTYSTVVPGLPGGPLLTDYPIDTDVMIPAWNTYQRPGIKAMQPRVSVQHGTANPNSLRKGEVNWLVNQRAGGGQTSFHACSDDTGVSVAVPADEVTWQAADGAGPGNMSGFSCEMIENAAMWASPARRRRAIYITADFMGRVAARLGIARPTYHWTYNYGNAPSARHRCPEQLMFVHPEAKDDYERQWYASRADELARMGGTAGLKAGDRVKATKAVLARRGWGTSQPVVMNIAAGTVGTVTDDGSGILVRQGNGMDWFNVTTKSGSGWVPVQDFEGVVDEKPAPAPQPTYAKPIPITALLATDLQKNDTAPGLVVDEGTEFVFVADVVEATKDTPRLQQGDRKAPRTGPDLKAGERFVVAWLFKSRSGEFFYLTPAPYWTRVAYADTKRISDAPLLGDERK